MAIQTLPRSGISLSLGDGNPILSYEIVAEVRRQRNFESTLNLLENATKTKEDNFIVSTGLMTAEAEDLLKIHGLNELPEKIIPKWYTFISQLWQPMPIMIWIAIIILLAIQGYTDMGILLFIQFANASIAFYEITKAGDAVAALKASLKPSATVYRDGKWTQINAMYLVPGDLVLLASGSAVPADCRVNEGEIEVDQAALTGESLPVTMYQGDSCKMGSTVVRGEVPGTVEFTGGETFFGKTAALLGVSLAHLWSGGCSRMASTLSYTAI